MIYFGEDILAPISRLEHAGTTNAEKVNWSFSKFVTTSREQTLPRNAPFCRKSLPKSVKNSMLLRLQMAKIHSGDTNPSGLRGHREWVKL